MEMLNPLAIQKQSLFPVGSENSGIASLFKPPQLPQLGTSIRQITPPSITPPQTDSRFPVPLQTTSPNMQNPYGAPNMQNTSNVDNLNLMIDNILKERLKEFFGGIMSMFDV